MGSSLHIYLGPFFKCKMTMAEVESKSRVCPKRCSASYGAYCNQCGLECETIVNKTTQYVSYSGEFYDEFIDSLFNVTDYASGPEDCDLYIPNHKGIGITIFRDGDLYLESLPDETEQILGKEKILAKYEEEYKYLKSLYGNKSVELHHGLISYYI